MLNAVLDDVVEALVTECQFSDSSSDSSGIEEESVSEQLLDEYLAMEQTRYLTPRRPVPRRSERMIDILNRFASSDAKRFRGFARMWPEAFHDLVDRLQSTKAFGDGARDHHWVATRVSTALFRLGRSGKGASARDIAVNCGCSEGSVINWTNLTMDALVEIKSEVLTFATEDERQKASAWVREKSGVDEWGKGWAVVDGTMIDLAWRPSLMPRQYYTYKVRTILTYR
jgi:hypothetical protein